MLSVRALAVLALSLPLVCSRRLLAPRATEPSADPFYQPPSDYASTEPGTILRTRTVTASIFGLIPDLTVETYEILFRTTAINGTAITSATTVFKPGDPKTDRFVSFQTAYDSASSTCDPSYSYQEGGNQSDLIEQLEFLVVEGYLLQNYIVSSSDYEVSLEAAFGAGRLAGTVTLDSMRAVSSFSELDFSTSTPDIVGVGYSGGAIATGWAASLQPTYAADLPIKGWTMGGTPANLTGVYVYIDGTLWSGFLPDGTDGLSKPSAYGAQLNDFLESILTSAGQSVLDFANSNCAVADLLNFAYDTLESTEYQSLGSGLLYAQPVAEVLSQCTMGIRANETPTAPVFIYHALDDEIIPYANASTLVHSWCDYGIALNFTTYAAGGHISTEILGIVDAYEFVNNAFAGEVATANGCDYKTVLNDTLDPLALGADLETVLVDLIDLLHDIGDYDQYLISNLSALVS